MRMTPGRRKSRTPAVPPYSCNSGIVGLVREPLNRYGPTTTDRRRDGYDPLTEMLDVFADVHASEVVREDRSGWTVEQRLSQRIIDGEPSALAPAFLVGVLRQAVREFAGRQKEPAVNEYDDLPEATRARVEEICRRWGVTVQAVRGKRRMRPLPQKWCSRTSLFF